MLYVSGLIVGETWSVFNLNGILIYRSIADDSKAKITLPFRGVYIVRNGNVTAIAVNSELLTWVLFKS